MKPFGRLVLRPLGSIRHARRLPLVFLALAACSSDSSQPGSAQKTSPSVCSDIIARYRARVAQGTLQCTSDAGCSRHGGVDPDDVCGGPIDAESGRALSKISSEIEEKGCPRLGYSCPAVELKCVEGTCR
ncbi:MAG: hypothetical protein HOW73_46970 [Polyangiaceae bacterium]|nr:hypothetical protein [Polyangiaceae bacterium]